MAVSTNHLDESKMEGLTTFVDDNTGKTVELKRLEGTSETAQYELDGAKRVKPVLVAATPTPVASDSQLVPGEVNRHLLEDFAKKHFAPVKRGFFRRAVPVKELIQWQKGKLKGSLIKMKSAQSKEAVKFFDLVQTIMGDNPKARGDEDKEALTLQLLEAGIKKTDFRDEIYCQIVKQVTMNPKPDSVRAGWTLLVSCLLAFPSSKDFQPTLLAYFVEHQKDTDNDVDKFAQYCAKELPQVCKAGARGIVPFKEEIRRARLLPFKPPIFGVSLDEAMSVQRAKYPELQIPLVLLSLTTTIVRCKGCATEGIFRVPGDADQIKAYRGQLDCGNYDMSKVKDPHLAASLLKLWLRELKEPIIPQELYDLCVKNTASAERSAEIVESKVPQLNKRIVHFFIRFLRFVALPEHLAKTKMTVNNLALVFAPNFLRCKTDNPQLMYENTKHECKFLLNLLDTLTVDDSLPQDPPSAEVKLYEDSC